MEINRELKKSKFDWWVTIKKQKAVNSRNGK